MRLLVDTHTFLWFAENDLRLSGTARSLIEDGANEVFLSLGSVWEMAIKVSQGNFNSVCRC
jgi:PIN domain nuclease of toxin-antitoxin system